jgi:hypothetical protein
MDKGNEAETTKANRVLVIRSDLIGSVRMFLPKLAMFALGASIAASELSIGHTTKYNARIPIGSEVVEFEGVCVNFVGSMTSPEFEGLERVETDSKTEFRRSKKVVKMFPDFIDVEVWAVPSICDSHDRHRQPKDLGVGAIDALTFRFSWKRDFDLRPAETVDSFKKHLSGGNLWFFYFQVKGEKVPLTDHLVLHVVGKDAKDLARLSGRL